MIEQQYYIRGLGCLLGKSDDYDTVAKTPLLKPEYIKKNIEPLCSYDLPGELIKKGEQDESKYPPKFLIYPTPTGEMIVGQAIYKSEAFTGVSPTFFMHNFVLSAKEKRRHVKEPEKLFGITGFATGFYPGMGEELPTLAGIPYTGDEPYFTDRSALFQKIGMSQQLFHKLIYAAFIAAKSKKKIFIALNTNLEELDKVSKALLYHLYIQLPWSITETLGVCTYSGKLEAKKSFQITFVDEGALNYDSHLNEELVFDFIHQRFSEMGADVEAEPYIKIAYKYAQNKVAWKKFNKWADLFRQPDGEEKDINFYGKVALMLDMSYAQKYRNSYDFSQAAVRTGLIKMLHYQIISPKISEDIRKELTEVLEYAIMQVNLRIAIGELLTYDELKVLLNFKLEINKGNLEQEAHCIQILLLLLETAYRENKLSYIDDLFEMVKAYPATYLHLYQEIYEREQLKERIAYPLIDEKLRGITMMEELMGAMSELEVIEPVLLSDSYYTQKLSSAFHTCVHSADHLTQLLLQVQKWAVLHRGILYSQLREACEMYFMKYASLKEIDSEETLCSIQFSRRYEEENYQVIKDYQRLRTDLSFMNPQKIRLNEKVQELVKRFYKQKAQPGDFYMLVYAFLEPGSEENGPRMNLKKVLSYLYEISPDLMLEFVVWSKGQAFYIEQDSFNSQVIGFFTQVKKKEGKIPRQLIKTKLGACAKTKKLCDKLLHLQKPSLREQIKDLRKELMVGTGIFIAGIGISFGSCMIYEIVHEHKVKDVFNVQEINLEMISSLTPVIGLQKPEVESYVREYILQE